MRGLVGGTVLTADGLVDGAVVVVDDGGVIAEVRSHLGDAEPVDVSGLHVLPGLVDLHGDAFERAVSPRPSVAMPMAMALAETDASLVACGITTSFWSITDAFEPGLRSRDTLRALLDALEGASTLRTRALVHVRHELTALDDHDELLGWLTDGRIDLFSINDHAAPAVAEHYADRVPLRAKTDAAWRGELLHRALQRRDEGHEQSDELCRAAVGAGVVVASHDDDTEEAVDRSLARGATIAEFPTTVDLIHRARAGGASVLMGAPNLVRGGSHAHFPAVAEVAALGALGCLCSDYHHLSLLHAPFVAVDLGLADLATAWRWCSTAAAKAGGIGDRTGAIEPGLQADLVVIDPAVRRPRSVWVGGHEVARSA